MKKELVYITYLYFWIIGLFGTAMLMTYVSEYLQTSGFFGDIILKTPLNHDCFDCNHEWGARHFWYAWMCFFLFILSIIRIIIWSFAYFEDTKK